MTKTQTLELIDEQIDRTYDQHDMELIDKATLKLKLSTLRLIKEYVKQITSLQ
jgi:hypothetical protein